MDLFTSVRCLYTLLFWMMYATETRATKPSRWISRNRAHSAKLHRSKRFDIGFKAEHPTPEKYLKNCCQNGGLCILGSFCQCKKEFYGRYCQYDVRKSDCGPVKHGEWFRSDCSLCRCHRGKPICLEGAYGECDPKVFTENYKPADPKNIIKIFPLDPGENYMENSWTDPPPAGSGHVAYSHVLLLMSALYISIGVV